MLKLIVVDDEKIIRETISEIIDWKSLGIELAGLCQNGIEAYNCILDVNPDLVLTDLRMPGMSGLELIEKCMHTNPDLQFIILSGYGEFEYAKAAMKYGVKHYLLKPCSEAQIIECIEECKAEAIQRRLTQKPPHGTLDATSRLHYNVLFSIIHDCICQNGSLPELCRSYESYIDFDFTPYRIFYIYYLPFDSLKSFLKELKLTAERELPSVIIHGVYVSNTLLLFFKNYDLDYSRVSGMISSWRSSILETALEPHTDVYASLRELLETLIRRISRFGLIYYINNFQPVYTCNYKSHIDEIEPLFQKIKAGDQEAAALFLENLERISSLNFLKQIASTMLLKLALESPDISPHTLTDWLAAIEKEEQPALVRSYTSDCMQRLLQPSAGHPHVSQMTQMIYRYVRENLSDSNLTLKYIAENHLYMNVDYVSKKFVKETGIRFSQFLTNERILRAKELLESGKFDKIQYIAEEIGLGNNPQYFSQLFKKATGMTPSAYQNHSEKE